jgi:hypothetical protein
MDARAPPRQEAGFIIQMDTWIGAMEVGVAEEKSKVFCNDKKHDTRKAAARAVSLSSATFVFAKIKPTTP